MVVILAVVALDSSLLSCHSYELSTYTVHGWNIKCCMILRCSERYLHIGQSLFVLWLAFNKCIIALLEGKDRIVFMCHHELLILIAIDI